MFEVIIFASGCMVKFKRRETNLPSKQIKNKKKYTDLHDTIILLPKHTDGV